MPDASINHQDIRLNCHDIDWPLLAGHLALEQLQQGSGMQQRNIIILAIHRPLFQRDRRTVNRSHSVLNYRAAF